MPRDGLNQYHRPPGTDAVTNYTIESTKYNAYVADVEQDLNLPRPIVAGGTGANNALQAMQNLGGEIAKQIITNYSSAPWVNGSFYSAAGATGAPNPTNRFAGIYYANADDSYATIEARDQTTGILYVQQKVAGVWSGTWLQGPGSLTDTDARYVNVTGDTMTGRLDITMPDPILALNKSGSGHGNGIYGTVGANARWLIQLGNASAESGSNAGSEFSILRYNDAGAVLGTPLTIQRSSGVAFFEGTVTTPGSFTCGGPVYAGNTGVSGTYYFGNSGTKSLGYDGTSFNLAGGPLMIDNAAYVSTNHINSRSGPLVLDTAGNAQPINLGGSGVVVNTNLTATGVIVGNSTVTAGATGATGTYYFGNSGTKSLSYDGTNFNLAGGQLYSGDHLIRNTATASNGQVTLGSANEVFFANQTSQTVLNWQGSGSYYFVITRAGGTLSYVANAANAFLCDFAGNFTITGSAFKPGGGPWTATSDARIKNELGDYTRGLAEITALRPIYYTYKGNDTTELPAYPSSDPSKEDNKAPLTVPYPNSPHVHAAEDATRYAGLIAQEAETVFPEMITKRRGYIDGEPVNDLRDLDTAPLIFALINAVKELSAKVAALEAK